MRYQPNASVVFLFPAIFIIMFALAVLGVGCSLFSKFAATPRGTQLLATIQNSCEAFTSHLTRFRFYV